MTKLCLTCNTTKPLTEYYKKKTRAGNDGLRPSCITCCREQSRKYYADNTEHVKSCRLQNTPRVAYHKEYYIKNKDRFYEYVVLNKDKLRVADLKRKKERRLEDPLYKLKSNIRCNIRNSMARMGFKKRSKASEILGCSYDVFKLHIENQFTEGMCWENAGKWHYDHIIPISSAKNEQDVIELNHYTNFQPLWAEDNISKSDKLNWNKT